jgi:capsular polysaccharide biosynthesis protein
MLKKIWLFIKTFKLNFKVYIGKPESSDEIQNDFKKEFDKEIQDHK